MFKYATIFLALIASASSFAPAARHAVPRTPAFMSSIEDPVPIEQWGMGGDVPEIPEDSPEIAAKGDMQKSQDKLKAELDKMKEETLKRVAEKAAELKATIGTRK
mmetsp:Transcript_28402/g.43709  ORF Transcript_28402/g.43709 Transcript_28402/m.43709 type:complete len:105 (+) Transcript_28402:65-379(+)